MDKKEKPSRKYRLVIFSESTFEEVRSFRFRAWYVWALLGLLVTVIVVLVVALLSLAPLRSLIYGADEYIAPEELIALRERVLDMEAHLQSQDLYINNLRQLLSGEVIQSADSSDLSLPDDSLYLVAKIREDSLLRRSFDLDEQLANVSTARQDLSASPRSADQLYFVPPVSGSISMGFDLEKEHLGLDINAPANTPIKAITEGYIIYNGWTLETGNTVCIQHDNNIVSFYKHNSTLLKKTGSRVEAGEAVAIIGNTGTLSTGPHLHFELWLDGKPVDPTKYINF